MIQARVHCMLDDQEYRHTFRICNISCFSTATMVMRTSLRFFHLHIPVSRLRRHDCLHIPPALKLRSWVATFKSGKDRTLSHHFAFIIRRIFFKILVTNFYQSVSLHDSTICVKIEQEEQTLQSKLWVHLWHLAMIHFCN